MTRFDFWQQLSVAHTESIVGRDEEDGRKLQAGIQIAVDKGVLEAQPQVLAMTKRGAFVYFLIAINGMVHTV